jgi:hypothetical protein
MHSALEQLLRDHGRKSGQPPPWGTPTPEYFQSLEATYGCRFPPSYIAFFCDYASRIPIADHGLKWPLADPGEEAYLSLEATIRDARAWGMPAHFMPFWEEESNFYCFDTQYPDSSGEFPVVFWEHDAPSDDEQHLFPTFVEWLRSRLRPRK